MLLDRFFATLKPLADAPTNLPDRGIVENQTGAGDTGFRFLQLGQIDWPDPKSFSLEPVTSFGKTG